MKALRSSPFLSPASLLHWVIFSCCAVGCFFSSAAWAVNEAAASDSASMLINLFMVETLFLEEPKRMPRAIGQHHRRPRQAAQRGGHRSGRHGALSTRC